MKPIDPISILKTTVATYRTQREAARALGVSTSLLNDLLHARRTFSQAMLRKLGLHRVVVREKA